jgi:hypothetical protein
MTREVAAIQFNRWTGTLNGTTSDGITVRCQNA